MPIFVAIVALIVTLPAAGFNQAKTNPDAKSFFQSSSHVIHDNNSID
jgi:hypothetical protein